MKMLKVKRFSPHATLPARAKPGDSGLDLYALNGGGIPPGHALHVDTGIGLELPFGYEGQVRPRSGLALRDCVTVLGSPGTVDSGYRGAVGVTLINHDRVNWFHFKAGDRIAQLVIVPVEYPEVAEVETLSETERGTGGFGSTGA